jgi:hypothetical protein
MHIVVPGLGLVFPTQSVECLIALFAASFDHAFAGTRQIERLGGIRSGSRALLLTIAEEPLR